MSAMSESGQRETTQSSSTSRIDGIERFALVMVGQPLAHWRSASERLPLYKKSPDSSDFPGSMVLRWPDFTQFWAERLLGTRRHWTARKFKTWRNSWQSGRNSIGRDCRGVDSSRSKILDIRVKSAISPINGTEGNAGSGVLWVLWGPLEPSSMDVGCCGVVLSATSPAPHRLANQIALIRPKRMGLIWSPAATTHVADATSDGKF